MRKERVIWSNYYRAVECMFEEEKQHGIEEGHFNEDVSDDTVWESVYEVLNSYLEDEKLNIAGKSSNTIVAIVDIGRWDGRVQGYRTFNCISEIFASGCDYSKWYSDGYNIRSTMTHHDGTNYILYREIKDEDKLEQFLEIIYSGKEISNSMLNYYTKSINGYYKKEYGW